MGQFNKDRHESVRGPQEVITKMAEKLEPPDPHKNSWEQFSFRLPIKKRNEDDFMNLCLSMIDVGLNNPVKPLEPDKTEEKDKDRAKCTASVIHQADKCLRKMVSAKIRDISKTEDQPASKELLQSHASHLN